MLVLFRIFNNYVSGPRNFKCKFSGQQYLKG